MMFRVVLVLFVVYNFVRLHIHVYIYNFHLLYFIHSRITVLIGLHSSS